MHERASSLRLLSVDDLARRVPQLSRDNLAMLAKIGALNDLSADAEAAPP